MVAECAALLDEARSQAMPLFYSRAIASSAGVQELNPRVVRLDEHLAGRLPEVSVDHQRWKTQIMDAVAAQPGDLVLGKTRPSCFYDTELEPVLRNVEVSRLIVAGLQTNVCVEATARCGLVRNLEMAVPEDAVSTDGPDLHRAALNSMRVLYTEVAPWRELAAPGARWDRAFTTPDYGRAPRYRIESASA